MLSSVVQVPHHHAGPLLGLYEKFILGTHLITRIYVVDGELWLSGALDDDRIETKLEDAYLEYTPAMVERIQRVVGATSYSLLLRNCEHVANYIVEGRWTSMQTCRRASSASGCSRS